MKNNFIVSFLDGLIEKKERIEKERLEKERLEKENNKIDLENKTNNIKKVENDIGKEIIGYLDTNTNLDNSLLKMDIGKDLEQGVDLRNKSVKELNNKNIDIKIVKNKKGVNVLWLLFEFIVGVILITYSLSYISGNEAESKFLSSSIQLWKNTAINLVGKIGFLAKDVEGNYIKKREKEISKLMELEVRLKSCIKDKENNNNKQLKELLYKVNSFKYEIMNTKLISLNDFIKNYNKFSLYGYSLKQATDKICSK